MSHPSLLIVAAALSLTAAQTPAPPADFAALTGRLEKAALNDDTQGVKDSRSAFLQMLAAAPAARTGAGVKALRPIARKDDPASTHSTPAIQNATL